MIPDEYEVKGSGPRTSVPSRPLFQGVTPESPQFRSVRGDFEPMVANEGEIVGALPQPAVWGTSTRNEAPTKDGPENFGGVHVRRCSITSFKFV
jgi:hypothetical protein